jgi:hypothetical protein
LRAAAALKSLIQRMNLRMEAMESSVGKGESRLPAE